MRLLVDTSVIIEFLRLKEKEQASLYKLVGTGHDLFVSITHTELFAGKSVWERETARQELDTIFEGLTVLALDEKVSTAAGFLRAQRVNVSLINCVIAATAIEYAMPVVTLNVKDFAVLPGLELYQLHNN